MISNVRGCERSRDRVAGHARSSERTGCPGDGTVRRAVALLPRTLALVQYPSRVEPHDTSDTDTDTAGSSEAVEPWTLEERPDGFVFEFHGARRLVGRLVATATAIALEIAFVILVVEFVRATGRPVVPIGVGVFSVSAGPFYLRLRRIWTPAETFAVSGQRLTHRYFGSRKEASRSLHLGAEVEIEQEPTYLADGLVSPREAPFALTLHTDGRTLGIGAGVSAADAERLVVEIGRRIAPERRPVPGRPGVVRRILLPVEAGGARQQRYLGQQRSATLGAAGVPVFVCLVVAVIMLSFGAVFVLEYFVTGRGISEKEAFLLLVGLVGVSKFAPRPGLLAWWRRSQSPAAWNADSAQRNGPRTWHRTWRDGPVRRSALRRMLSTRAMVTLPGIVVVLAWIGAPESLALTLLALAGVVCAMLPMTVYLWQLAFSGTTEVSAAAPPLVPGERAEIHFALHRGAAAFESIAFRLVRVELRRSGRLRSRKYWTTHEGVYHLPPDTPPPGPSEEVPTFFDIPADAGGTDEGATPIVRWFLEVRGVTSAGPYIEVFQVPVFDPVVDAAAGDTEPGQLRQSSAHL